MPDRMKNSGIIHWTAKMVTSMEGLAGSRALDVPALRCRRSGYCETGTRPSCPGLSASPRRTVVSVPKDQAAGAARLRHIFRPSMPSAFCEGLPSFAPLLPGSGESPLVPPGLFSARRRGRTGTSPSSAEVVSVRDLEGALPLQQDLDCLAEVEGVRAEDACTCRGRRPPSCPSRPSARASGRRR